jgi:hypothetical protein
MSDESAYDDEDEVPDEPDWDEVDGADEGAE